jgi:hypothetical protein
VSKLGKRTVSAAIEKRAMLLHGVSSVLHQSSHGLLPRLQELLQRQRHTGGCCVMCASRGQQEVGDTS